MVVVAAGYTERMDAFIDSNPGLKSRFSRVIEFPDYTAGEMLLIADGMAKEHNFLFEDNARAALGQVLLSEESDRQELHLRIDIL